MDIEVECEHCGKKSMRPRGEVNRSKKIGRPMYCSRGCAGSANLKNIPEDKRTLANLLRGGGRKADGLSQFRWHMRRITNHEKNRGHAYHRVEVSLDDLKAQWDLQCGVCPYTGWKLKAPRTCGTDHGLGHTPDRASVDRIDSSKGYTKDNIQFVSLIAQYAKNQFSEVELVQFCEAVAARC